jgi:hypothetical protein
MRRYGKLFERITDPENLLAAHRAARKGKSWQRAVQRVEADLEGKLAVLRTALVARTFTTSSYREKRIFEPKERTIYRLPYYPDRIVQHALVRVMEPIWDGMFVGESYACRKGKGGHAGSRKTMEYVRRFAYCLKCDISKFYPSIDQEILFGIICRKIKCSGTLWLIGDIIRSFPGGKNVPIGNYTSQWFGNLYLNEIDRFVKDELRVRPYVRYCDDFCLFDDDKRRLGDAARAIKQFAEERLKLKLSKCDLFPVKRGVDFLGYRHFPGYVLVRKSTAKRVKERILRLPDLLASGRISIETYRSSLASTMGWLRWANSFHLRSSLDLENLWDRARHAA